MTGGPAQQSADPGRRDAPGSRPVHRVVCRNRRCARGADRVLTEFSSPGIDVTRIESRPAPGESERAALPIDCDGHRADARVDEALSALHRSCDDVRVLGSSPRADEEQAEVRPGAADDDLAAASARLAGVREGQA